MSPLDALYAFEDLRARLLVPIHHGAFALSYERLDEKRPPAINLVKRVPRVLQGMAKLTYVIRFGGKP